MRPFEVCTNTRTEADAVMMQCVYSSASTFEGLSGEDRTFGGLAGEAFFAAEDRRFGEFAGERE